MYLLVGSYNKTKTFIFQFQFQFLTYINKLIYLIDRVCYDNVKRMAFVYYSRSVQNNA